MSKKVPVNIHLEINACWDTGWVHVWVGILHDQLLGQVALPNSLGSAVYYHLLANDLPVLLEHVPRNQQQHMWFVHDGAQGTTFSLYCQTVPEPDFWWTVDRTQRPHPLACIIPRSWSCGFLAKVFSIFSADQWLRDITATSRGCLPECSSETRNFRQSAHLCVMSWKLCWIAWEWHTASAVEITQTLPISQQALVSGLGLFCSLTWLLQLLKACKYFVNILYMYETGGVILLAYSFVFLSIVWS
jgi:hypothetical protein